jgi:lysozyme family protein
VAVRLAAPAAKARYHAVEAATGVPWFVVAVFHERERSVAAGKGLLGSPMGQTKPMLECVSVPTTSTIIPSAHTDAMMIAPRLRGRRSVAIEVMKIPACTDDPQPTPHNLTA